jgi:hypothetical protein
MSQITVRPLTDLPLIEVVAKLSAFPVGRHLAGTLLAPSHLSGVSLTWADFAHSTCQRLPSVSWAPSETLLIFVCPRICFHPDLIVGHPPTFAGAP